MSVAANAKAAVAGTLIAAFVFVINLVLTGHADPATALGFGIICGLTWRVWSHFLAAPEPSAQGE